MMQTDVLIVGGGPAGLSAAIAASKKGFRVTVVDARKGPIDKPCGEGLLPEAVSALRVLGIEQDAIPGYRFSGIRFSDPYSSAVARFDGCVGIGARRTALHQLLAERAETAGASLLWGSRLKILNSRDVLVEGQRFSCRWLIAADGMNSQIRRWARLGPRSRVRGRFAFRQHFAVAPWVNLVDVYWAKGCEIIVTPTGTEEICVALFTANFRLRIRQALAKFPELSRRLQGARPTSSEAGALTAVAVARQVVRKNIALVGDASCLIDGIAGQGLNLAFRQAIHLGEALSRGSLKTYAVAHRDITETPQCITRLLLLMDRYSWVRKKTLRRFAAEPELFAKMIAIHAGTSERAPFGLQELFGLGWQVLVA